MIKSSPVVDLSACSGFVEADLAPVENPPPSSSPTNLLSLSHRSRYPVDGANRRGVPGPVASGLPETTQFSAYDLPVPLSLKIPPFFLPPLFRVC